MLDFLLLFAAVLPLFLLYVVFVRGKLVRASCNGAARKNDRVEEYDAAMRHITELEDQGRKVEAVIHDVCDSRDIYEDKALLAVAIRSHSAAVRKVVCLKQRQEWFRERAQTLEQENKRCLQRLQALEKESGAGAIFICKDSGEGADLSDEVKEIKKEERHEAPPCS